MKNKLWRILTVAILLVLLIIPKNTVFAVNDGEYYLGGFPIGFSINTEGVEVVGLSNVATQNGNVSPSKDKFQIGDILLEINGKDINTANDIELSLKDYFIGDAVIAKVDRKNKIIYLDLEPAQDLNGKYRLGLYVRNNICGIGTTTYVKVEDGYYASLGHPVLNERGDIIKITGGEAYACNISGVIKSKKGQPGELQGVFVKDIVLGNVIKNVPSGVYGYMDNLNVKKLTKIDASFKPAVGKAFIYTTLDGTTPKKYTINIVKIDKDNADNKNFVVKITDESLIKETGGIVQGMSGSPIVQNGKLIGAITHVFVNDPTRGFGIAIENMINE